MRKMHAGVAKSDACIRGGEHHLSAGLEIVRFVDDRFEVGGNHFGRFRRPDIADRIRSLVCRSESWALRGRTTVVRQRRVGLDRMTEHVQRGTGRDHGRHRKRIDWIEDAKHRPERPVSDTSFHVHRRQIEDRGAGRLTAGTRGGGNGDERTELAGNGFRLANRRIDIGQQVGGVGCIQVRGLGGVDDRAAPNRDVAVEPAIGRKLCRFRKGNIGRLHARIGVERKVDPRGFQRFDRRLYRNVIGQTGIGDDHHSGRAQILRVFTDFSRDTLPVLDGRGVHGEGGFERHGFSSLRNGDTSGWKYLTERGSGFREAR